MSRPRTAIGALVGGLLGAALTSTLFLANRLAGLPFAPFDVFDWLARTLPGTVVTAGIDTMVALLRALGVGELSAAAKTAEQTLAVIGLLTVTAGVGAAVFAFLRRRDPGVPGGPGAGLVAGLAAGAPAAWAGAAASTGTVAGAAWTLAAFLVWGGAVGRAYRRLAAAGDTAAGGPAAGRPRARGPTPRYRAVDRRRFLIRLGGATAAITVAGAGVGVALGGRRDGGPGGDRRAPWSSRNPLPNAGAEVEPVPGTRPELTPVEDHYRIDINTRPPAVDPARWRLTVDGLVDRPAERSLRSLRERYEPVHRLITLSCISNPIAGDLIGTTRWTGLRLTDLLDDVGIGPEATHLRVRSVDGFHETVALDLVRRDPRLMLAYAWDGLPLPREHGFPLRIYIPNRYGMKQPKWIDSIEVTSAYEPGYWVERGWDRDALMHATSVIDVVASAEMAAAGRDTVPVGGIAHAGDRGIARVEIRVDDGPWQPARLREPLSGLTWVLWRWEWTFEPGEHTLAVRCVDGEGNLQVAEPSPIRPDGATGLHRRTVQV